MDELDTEKLETVLRLLKESGCAHFRFGELEIHFPDEESEGGECVSAIGFEAQGTDPDEDEDMRARRAKAPAYSMLFPAGLPRMKRS